MITGEALGPEVELLVSFILFIDHKITCCRNELLHALNGSGTLGTVGTCIFL